MIGAAELELLKSTAWLINVGRGATIDEQALLLALRAGSIGDAALDAWTTEPLPRHHPAWELTNMIVSPHSAASSPVSTARSLDLIAGNIRHFVAGAPLENVVDLSAGY